MGKLRMGPPEELLLALQRQTGAACFVETGTYRGDTAAWAARHFARVVTVELSPEFGRAAAARFRAEPKIEVLEGPSGAVLRGVVPTLAGPAIFWLDAHWIGGTPPPDGVECPVLDELAAIDDAPAAHTILVDDARLFCSPPPRPHHAAAWPDLATLVGRLARGGARYVAMLDDVFVAVPSDSRDFLSAWLQDVADQRRARERRRWWRRDPS